MRSDNGLFCGYRWRWWKAILTASMVTLVFGGVVGAQEKKDPRRLDLLDLMSPDRTNVSLTQPAGMALESTVDPERYYVGPSDMIAVNIWMSPPQNYTLTVTPEGTLIIPTIGEVRVSDLTLAEAKKKILSEARKKYLNVEITATLVKPRPIIVSVVGTVLNPGLYTINAVDRTNRAIDEANKLSRFQTGYELEPVLRTMSMRNIVVKHRDGSFNRVDLQKYFATHDESLNPYLREGDIVVVPKRDPLKNVFAVYGQFNTNGRFEYVPGDSLLDAIKIANGLTGRALPEEAIFSRMNDDGTSLSNKTINLAAIMDRREPNIPLQPGDRIIVKARSDERADYNVDIRGEVRYPGTYPITRNRTRLSEVIRDAGGFTDFASLDHAEIVRQTYLPENVKEIEKEEILSMRGRGSSSDTTGYEVESLLRIHQEAVVVDFKKLFVDKDTSQDVILQREDQIIVPSRYRTVYVFGQVVSPGHIPFVEGKDVGYYVRRAGGFADHANEGDVKIIKAKTKQWLKPGDTRIEEADNVWIPAEVEHPFGYYMTVASQMATVVSVVIGLAVIIVQLRK